MNRYIIIDLTTGKHIIGVIASTKKGAIRWANSNGFYNRFNAVFERGL